MKAEDEEFAHVDRDGQRNSRRVITVIICRTKSSRCPLGYEIKLRNGHVQAITFAMILGGCIYMHHSASFSYFLRCFVQMSVCALLETHFLSEKTRCIVFSAKMAH